MYSAAALTLLFSISISILQVAAPPPPGKPCSLGKYYKKDLRTCVACPSNTAVYSPRFLKAFLKVNPECLPFLSTGVDYTTLPDPTEDGPSMQPNLQPNKPSKRPASGDIDKATELVSRDAAAWLIPLCVCIVALTIVGMIAYVSCNGYINWLPWCHLRRGKQSSTAGNLKYQVVPDQRKKAAITGDGDQAANTERSPDETDGGQDGDDSDNLTLDNTGNDSASVSDSEPGTERASSERPSAESSEPNVTDIPLNPLVDAPYSEEAQSLN